MKFRIVTYARVLAVIFVFIGSNLIGDAIDDLKKKAEQGLAEAQCSLGLAYLTGEKLGVTQDYKEAVKWFTKAAEQGYADGQVYLGGMYAAGRGVIQDHKEAVKWITKAAEQGNAVAEYNLATFFQGGVLGIIQNQGEAAKWYLKSAMQGYAEAQEQLGLMYFRGEVNDGKDSSKEAFRWLKAAAEKGIANAQSLVGVMYYMGTATVQDFVQAHAWLNLACANGDEKSHGFRDDIVAKLMTPEQIAKAQELAKEYFEKYQPKK